MPAFFSHEKKYKAFKQKSKFLITTVQFLSEDPEKWKAQHIRKTKRENIQWRLSGQKVGHDILCTNI